MKKSDLSIIYLQKPKCLTKVHPDAKQRGSFSITVQGIRFPIQSSVHVLPGHGCPSFVKYSLEKQNIIKNDGK